MLQRYFNLKLYKKKLISFRFFVILILLLLSSFSITYFYIDRTNTLSRSSDWKSIKLTKPDWRYLSMGARDFINDPYSLKDFKLNLGAWHGNQELERVFRPNVSLKKIEFVVEVPEGAYLSIILKNEQKKFALRLSNDPQHPSAFFQLKEDGEFNNLKLIPKISLSKKNKISFVLDQTPNRIVINGITVPISIGFTAQTFSIRGGYNPVYVNQIKTFLSDRIICDNFLFYSWSKIFWVFILIFVFLFLLSQISLAITSLITIFSIFFTLAHYTYFSNHYSPYSFSLETYIVEQAKRNFLNQEGAIKEHLRNKVTDITLGASQCYGEGISKPQEIYTEQLKLTNLCVNAFQVKDIEQYILPFIPSSLKNIYIHLSYNDANDIENFSSNLQNISQKILQKNLSTIVIIPPYSKECKDLINVFDLHNEILKKESKKFHFKIIDMEKRFNSISDTGFIFWDCFHFTDYGHHLFKAMIEKDIIKLKKQTYL